MNCSLSCLSTSWYLNSTAVVHSLPIHSSTLSFHQWTNLQNCNDFITSLNCGLNFFLRVSNRLLLSLYVFCSSFVRVAMRCRPSLPCQSLITDTLYVCLDYSSVSLKVCCFSHLSSGFQLNVGCFRMGPLIFGSWIFLPCHASCGHGFKLLHFLLLLLFVQ